MRRPPVPSLLTATLAAFALLVVPASAQVSAPGEEAPPPAAPVPAQGPEPRQKTVGRQLDALLDAGRITREAHDVARERYAAARATRGRLSGRRRVELASVLGTLEAVAKRGELSSTRVPLAFETLERNRQWWTTGALLAYGARVGFRGSELVWQSYPGEGIQVQWLGTWAKANALYNGKRYDTRLRALLDEAVALGARRAGGIAYESWFTFDGGRPPWVSGLSQGTALQALARGGTRLGEPRYLDAARSALGIFRVAPPEGVRVRTSAGAHYAQYSFAPKLRILNGFTQALNGLHDYGAMAGDASAGPLFAAGDRQLRTELPQADTGAWSRYSVGGRESDLGYHRLLRDFLRGLCERTDTRLYCDTATRFTANLTRPPVLALVASATPATEGRTTRVSFTLDKVSSVSFVATRDGKVVHARTERLPRGRHAFTLPKLRSAAPLALRLSAVDPAGNTGATTGTLPVRPRPRTGT